MELSERHKEYWSKNLVITGVLLFTWFIATFGVIFFADQLNDIVIFGFPMGFYMAAQGSLIIYVVVIGIYALYMNKLDVDYDVAEE
ncbi:MAG: DUF4212 domain-containing protein [Nitrospinae bacterium]|nr:DUF4212 domain-containing protein [Nitrospinota bacterium]MBF0634922.1 DUF4212 domain-containing protein [Nitrospinota bacterium]